MNEAPSSILGITLTAIYLNVNGIKYPCTNVSLSYEINDVPSAQVTVGCGVSLSSPDKTELEVSPEELLMMVLTRRDMAYRSMIPCSIAYDIEKDNTAITVTLLEGYIASGAVHYTTEPVTTRTISFLCLHKACMLMIRPVADYIYACNTAIAVALANKGDLDSANAKKFIPVPSTTILTREAQVEDILKDVKDSTPISDIIGKCIDKLIQLQSYVAKEVDKQVPTVNVTNYITSSYSLNASTVSGSAALDSSVRTQYVASLYNDIISLMQHNDIWNLIKAVVNLNHRCLNVVPKGADAGFKLAIEPSKAWLNYNALTLYATDIHSIKTSFSPVDCLHTPDIFMVNFDASVFIANNVSDMFKLTGDRGVFTLSKDLTEYIKTQQSKNNVIDPNAYNRVKCVSAPDWLLHCFWRERYIAIKEDKTGKELPKHNKTINDGTNKSIAVNARFSKDEKTIKTADAIAQALFTHSYGTTETSSISLNNTALLGFNYTDSNGNVSTKYLHEMIGELIDINMDIDRQTELTSSPLNIRGRLKKVEIEYHTGTHTAMSYDILLDCVRPFDPNEEEDEIINIECPLYKEITNG